MIRNMVVFGETSASVFSLVSDVPSYSASAVKALCFCSVNFVLVVCLGTPGRDNFFRFSNHKDDCVF